jgi:diketogulonate reductase-like aldo/keto reductase
MNAISKKSTINRLSLVHRHFTPSQTRSFQASALNMAKVDMNTKVKLASGEEIYQMGYGVYQTPSDVAEEVVDHAIKVGYRHVDSATAYRNEEPSAKGMLKSGVPREQLFFTSKVPPRDVNYEGAKKCVDESLKKTGLVRAYLDLHV